MSRSVAEPAGTSFSGRPDSNEYPAGFGDLHPPLGEHEAHVEADRCYFCFDAPCTKACPTSIDIPLFIRQIQAVNPDGAAETILSANILGGMCARVCPVETLCEEACVRNLAEDRPVRIGMLQRYATDHLMEHGEQPFERASPTGKRIAIVGAGPAGLACAHRLAQHGHDVVILDRRDKPGGLNEYGIAAYKTVDDFAQREVEFILSIGGITIQTGRTLGRDLTLDELRQDYDAVFLALGMAGVNALAIDGADADGCGDAVAWIAELRQASDLSTVPVGRRVVVIGGGMTAIDAAVQSKLLGAEEVTIAYRRGQEAMKASLWEQELAQTHGVTIRHRLSPLRVETDAEGKVSGVVFMRTGEDGHLADAGESVTIAADTVFKAIGQTFEPQPLTGDAPGILLESGRIAVDAEGRTSMPGIWAGGDCVAGGEDLTVAAAQDGKVAAESIHRALGGAVNRDRAMDAIEQKVSHHYTSEAGSHLERIKVGLLALGIDLDNARPVDLKPVDEFHTGGMEATEALLEKLDIGTGTRVLDIGSGIGGTARLIADRFDATVTGVDLTPEFVATARQLTKLVGLQDRAYFEVGSATSLPVEDGAYSLALLLHVGMNVADKRALFAEARRALSPGGTFAVYDVMLGKGGGELTFPVPWSSVAESSFVEAPEVYREAAAANGLSLVSERDRSDFAKDFFTRVRARIEQSGGPPPLGIHLLMGNTAAQKLGNYVEMLEAGRIAPIEMIFRVGA